MRKTILVGVTGGIAAVKIPELVKLLNKTYDVSVILTRGAQAIVSPDKFTNSAVAVYTNLFDNPVDSVRIMESRSVQHIDVAKKTKLLIIAPATANIIAKLAAGLADDYLTTVALAVTCPIIVCPAMNVAMWKHPATQHNIAILRQRGVMIVEPEDGLLACGDVGQGRLADIRAIVREINRAVKKSAQLEQKRVIVTAGSTLEKIDDIRFITNKSSGKMGAALAEACYLRGAFVTFVRSRSSVSSRYPVYEELFENAEELEAILARLVPTHDICIHAAAVSDFKVKEQYKGKSSSDQPLPLELEPRKKILNRIKRYNPAIFLVAFKAEWQITDEQLVALAQERLRDARADLIVANDVGRINQGFQSDENEVFIINAYGHATHVRRSSKRIVADSIVNHIIRNI